MGLRDADLNRLLDALRECARPSSGDVREQILAVLEKIVSCDIVAYQTIDRATGVSENLERPRDWVTGRFEEVFRHHLPEHPLLRHFLHTGDGEAVALSDVTSRRELRRLGIYQDFLRPLGIEHQLICLLTEDGATASGLVVNRGPGDFTRAERQLVRLARPHLANLVATAHAEAWFDAALTALDEIDDTAHGVILLGPLGRVRVANRTARLLLASYFRRPGQEGGPLPEELASWLAEQRRVPDRAAPGPPRPYVVRRGSRQLTVRLFDHRSSAALLLRESGNRPQPASASGLTVRQVDVLWLVANGRTSAQVARALRISGRTVEKHLENIYAKLGVTSRPEAVLRVFGSGKHGA